jgi:hypothetical protein
MELRKIEWGLTGIIWLEKGLIAWCGEYFNELSVHKGQGMS